MILLPINHPSNGQRWATVLAGNDEIRQVPLLFRTKCPTASASGPSPEFEIITETAPSFIGRHLMCDAGHLVIKPW